MHLIRKTKAIVFAASLLCLSNTSWSQNSTAELLDLSLEELMNMEIVSASKKSESVFNSPMSSYTLSKEEINQAGSTSIPDALRLIPNIIVREQANGVYDIHLRGMDNMAGRTDAVFQPNTSTLVMIDNRPVFNYNQGGTYWETLPIDINDVERIEVVNGPSAPLFGPNAVTGVINIITKQNTTSGANVSTNVQYGNFNTLIGGVRAGYKGQKFDIGVSANIESRDRSTQEYFEFAGNRFVNQPADLRDFNGMPLSQPDQQLPTPSRALQRQGANVFGNYYLKDNIRLGFQAGTQNSEIQRMYFNNEFTPFSFNSTQSNYLNLTADIDGLNIRYSYNKGLDDLNSMSQQFPFKYDIENTDLFVDYTWNVHPKISIQPGFNIQNASIDTRSYMHEGVFNMDILGGARSLQTIAGSLRFDAQITDHWRFVSAARVDKFSQPDDVYLSYQFATTYKLNDKNLLRAVISRSNSGSFIGPAFLEIEVTYPVPGTPFNGINIYSGNEQLNLFTLNLYELGYRSRVSERVELNVEVFRQHGNNFMSTVRHPIPMGFLPQASNVLMIENLPVEAVQTGVTLSANIVGKNGLHFKPFLTIQQTQALNMPSALFDPGFNDTENVTVTSDEKHTGTPSAFGGAYLNFRKDKWNFNLNPYFISAHQIRNVHEHMIQTNVGEINDILMLNVRVSYQLLPSLSLYVNGRNITNNAQRQFFGTDAMGAMILGGLQFRMGY